jgi:amino acid adenylation domain-containing protein
MPGSDENPVQYGKTIAESFTAAALRVPDRVAVTAADGDLTYRTLLDRARGLAGALRRAGAVTDVPVPLLVPTGVDLVVAVVAAALAGVPYAPVNPADPVSRIRRLVGGAPVALVAPETAHLAADAIRVVVGDEAPDELPAPGETDLAYVIHTSGSTGQPKGVLVDNRAVIRLFSSTWPWFRFDANDVWTLFHAVTFDFSVWETWGALLHGGRLVVVPPDMTRDPRRFRALVVDEGVTVLNQTPSAFRQFVGLGAAPDKLRLVVLGGERLDVGMLRPWFDRNDDGPRVVNMYGITETTVHASYRPVTAADLADPTVSPIGVPLPDLVFHVRDDGELFIGGPGLARGYLGRDDLTEERFTDLDGVRVYRTGDRVRRLPDGGYAYLGRVDDQLSVRGYRIEPTEVEAAFGARPDVVAAVVAAVDHGDGDVRLVAYVVTRPGADREAVRQALVERADSELPRHLRPSSYLFVDEIPLTRNGKVDRAALAVPVPTGDTPESAVERIWLEVLGAGHDHGRDFFDQGGTSLSLLRLVSRVEEHFGVSLDLSALLDGVTVAALAHAVDRAVAETKG